MIVYFFFHNDLKSLPLFSVAMASTAVVPILVTDEDDIDQWKSRLTGQDTLDLEKRTAFNEEVPICFLPDPIQDAQTIHALDIFHLDSIPSRAAVMKAGDMLQNAHNDPVNNNKDLSKGCYVDGAHYIP